VLRPADPPTSAPRAAAFSTAGRVRDLASDALCRARPLPTRQGRLGQAPEPPPPSPRQRRRLPRSRTPSIDGWRSLHPPGGGLDLRPSPSSEGMRAFALISPTDTPLARFACDRSRGQGGGGPAAPVDLCNQLQSASKNRSLDRLSPGLLPRFQGAARRRRWGSQASLPGLRSCLRRHDVAWCRVAPPRVSATSPRARLEGARNDTSRGFTGQRPRYGLCPLGALSGVMAHAARLLRHRDCSRGEASPQPDPLGHLLS